MITVCLILLWGRRVNQVTTSLMIALLYAFQNTPFLRTFFFFFCFWQKTQQNHSPWMTKEGYAQIFGKANKVQIQWLDGRKDNCIHLPTINTSDMKCDP